MIEKRIYYSQCWEDPEILSKALRINENDSVLSISSGGDNTLSLLCLGPKKIVSIDVNPTQNYLLELKLAAVMNLSYQKLLAFLGIESSKNRLDTYKKLRSHLTPQANTWWSKHQSLIDEGVINCGRFEKFLTIFRKYILPFIHSRKTIYQFTAKKSIKEQQEYYKNRWNSKRWRLYFRFASSRFMLEYFARQKRTFTYVQTKRVASNYLKRLEIKLSNVSLSSNYFMLYCLTGGYGQSVPPYLEQKNQERYREAASSLSIVTNDVFNYLKSAPESSISKYNLSDIFEALSSEENDKLWEEIIRTSRKGARIAYWDNLMNKPIPAHFSSIVRAEKQLASKLYTKDRVFFYSDFHIFTILK